MTSWQIYWLLMLDNIGILALIIGFFGTIGSIPLAIAVLEEYFESSKISLLVLLVPILTVSIFMGGFFIPSTKQMAVILVAPKIINNEQVQKLPQQVLDLANDWMNELKPKEESNE